MIEAISILFFSLLGISAATSNVSVWLHRMMGIMYFIIICGICSFHPNGLQMGALQVIGIMSTIPVFLMGFYYRQKNIINRQAFVLRFMADGVPKNKGLIWDTPVSFFKTFRFRLILFIFGSLLILISHLYASAV